MPLGLSGSGLITGFDPTASGFGKVLQVVSTAKTDTFTTTSTSFTDLTGVSIAITPSSATSKILVLVSLSGHGQENTNHIQYQIIRNTTALSIGDAAGSRTRATGAFGWASTGTGITQSANAMFLDSPNTTSSTTYKVQVRASLAGTIYINRTQNDTDGAAQPRTTSTITVMEIAA